MPENAARAGANRRSALGGHGAGRAMSDLGFNKIAFCVLGTGLALMFTGLALVGAAMALGG